MKETKSGKIFAFAEEKAKGKRQRLPNRGLRSSLVRMTLDFALNIGMCPKMGAGE